MSKILHIGKLIGSTRWIPFPADASAVTQTVGLVGHRGSGKSYAGQVYCEELYKLGGGLSFLILSVTGVGYASPPMVSLMGL